MPKRDWNGEWAEMMDQWQPVWDAREEAMGELFEVFSRQGITPTELMIGSTASRASSPR